MTVDLLDVGKEAFLDRLKQLFLEKPDTSLFSFQKMCFDKFLSLGLPDKTKENFQYVPLARLYDEVFEGKQQNLVEEIKELLLPESSHSYFVFVDGVFAPEYSAIEGLPKQVVVLPLSTALAGSYSAYLKHRMQMLVQEESDPLALLNGALYKEGLFLYVPPKVRVEVPIQCIFLQTGKEVVCMPRVHFFVGAQGEVKVVSSVQGDAAFYNGFLDVSLEERAICHHTAHFPIDTRGGSFSFLRATLKKGSFFKSHLVTFGGYLQRYDYKVVLLGERAEAELVGLSPLNGSNQAHVNVHVEHRAESCRSYQLFKNVLLSKSRSSFTGKIYVQRVAQKTEAYQLNKNLVLSDLAMVFSKPNLEIFADDVKASHGSTISQLEEDQLLYLRARGISLNTARALLTQGFCGEILDKIEIESLRSKLLLLSLACLK